MVTFHLRKAKIKEAGRAPEPRGQREGSKRRGQAGPHPLPEGPKKPRQRLLTNFLPGRTQANSPCAGARRRAGLVGAPAGPSGVSRERSRSPPGCQRAQGSPQASRWAGGGGVLALRSAPPAGLRGSGPGARAPGLESPATGDLPLRSPPREVVPVGASARVRRPSPWRSRAESRSEASLAQAARGLNGGPCRRDSRPRSGREYEPLSALPALPADRPRSPGAPRAVSAPASSSAPQRRDLCQEGAS